MNFSLPKQLAALPPRIEVIQLRFSVNQEPIDQNLPRDLSSHAWSSRAVGAPILDQSNTSAIPTRLDAVTFCEDSIGSLLFLVCDRLLLSQSDEAYRALMVLGQRDHVF